jgi:hypothetical protein
LAARSRPSPAAPPRQRQIDLAEALRVLAAAQQGKLERQ